jgi:hypothetical protein
MSDPTRDRLSRLCDEAFDLTCRLWDRYRDDQRLLSLLMKAKRRERRRDDALWDYDRRETKK